MIRVDEVETAARFYSTVFGLRPLWKDTTSVGLGFPETDTEIVLHCDAQIPSKVAVHYLVDDVAQAVQSFHRNGCSIVVEPFEIAIGRGAVIRDPFGTTLCILDMRKGPRQPQVG